jgi:hypothetical protein
MQDLPQEWPHSFRGINDLPKAQRNAIYQTLIPDWFLQRFNIEYEGLGLEEIPNVRLRAPRGSRAIELSVFADLNDKDPSLYINLADTFMGQLMVLLVVMNDLKAPRYNIDVDEHGRPTNLGTSSRNIPEEIRAMKDGLTPGQVRPGLRGFRKSLPFFEVFVERMGHDMFLIEPLCYHNAILFERAGFGYTYGRKEMERIHREFQPGGEIHMRLDETNPFRQPSAWETVRGRSWAIHDGVLGHPFTGFHMYKRLRRHANVTTFPDFEW